MELPTVTWRCNTYGRELLVPRLLGQFFGQDYPEHLLDIVILNDDPGIFYQCDDNRVKFYNYGKRFGNIREKMNVCTGLCCGEVFIPVADDEIIEASRIISESGILPRYDRISGMPYEGPDDIEAVNELISNLHRPFILREFPLINNPKTDFTKRLLKDKIITEKDVQGICTNVYKKWGVFTHFKS